MFSLQEIVNETKEGQWPYYIYVLHKPDGTPFYIGKGKVSGRHFRVAYHEDEAKNGHHWKRQERRNNLKLNTIRKIWRSGGCVGYSIDSWHNILESVDAREIELIATIGRQVTGEGPLANISEGGDGYNKSPETIRKISEGLRQYFQDNPEVIQKMSEEGKKRFADPAARELARQNAINNATGDYIVKWLKEHPEEAAEKFKRHGGVMKKWYSENPQEAQDLATRRNEKLRSEEHRAKMKAATAEYIKNNPEADRLRRLKTKQKNQARWTAKKKCLKVVHDWLVATGKIRGIKKLTVGYIRQWHKAGKVSDETMKLFNDARTAEDWERVHGEISEFCALQSLKGVSRI